jgi:hypothetical protein
VDTVHTVATASDREDWIRLLEHKPSARRGASVVRKAKRRISEADVSPKSREARIWTER